MFKVLQVFFFSFLFFTLSNAEKMPEFQKFDVVEIQTEKYKIKMPEFIKKPGQKKYGVVISGNSYNRFSKTVIIMPLVSKSGKGYKGRFIFEFSSKNGEYLVFTDKLRTVRRDGIAKSNIFLGAQDKEKVQRLLNDILKQS